jgi:ribosomal protein L31
VAKADIHPTWYPEAKVYCNGEVVMTVGSTQPKYGMLDTTAPVETPAAE